MPLGTRVFHVRLESNSSLNRNATTHVSLVVDAASNDSSPTSGPSVTLALRAQVRAEHELSVRQLRLLVPAGGASARAEALELESLVVEAEGPDTPQLLLGSDSSVVVRHVRLHNVELVVEDAASLIFANVSMSGSAALRVRSVTAVVAEHVRHSASGSRRGCDVGQPCDWAVSGADGVSSAPLIDVQAAEYLSVVGCESELSERGLVRVRDTTEVVARALVAQDGNTTAAVFSASGLDTLTLEDVTCSRMRLLGLTDTCVSVMNSKSVISSRLRVENVRVLGAAALSMQFLSVQQL